jgi:hypothetical protein
MHTGGLICVTNLHCTPVVLFWKLLWTWFHNQWDETTIELKSLKELYVTLLSPEPNYVQKHIQRRKGFTQEEQVNNKPRG